MNIRHKPYHTSGGKTLIAQPLDLLERKLLQRAGKTFARQYAPLTSVMLISLLFFCNGD